MKKTSLHWRQPQKRVRDCFLLAWPPIVVRLLFGAEISGAGVIMSRIAGHRPDRAGVSLLAGQLHLRRLLNGMLTYSTLAMLYLMYIGVRGEAVGVLLVAGGCGPCDPGRSSRPRAIAKNEKVRHGRIIRVP